MKISRQYAALSLVSALAVAGLTLGSVGFAQTVTPLACAPVTQTVGINQKAVLTASGGNGSYYWSGDNLTITNPTGTQFTVSYPSPGTYTVHVSSSGQTAGCTISVIGSSVGGTLACYPSSASVTLGTAVTFTANGGNGTYTWSAPDLTVTNPYGTGFIANYASIGTKTVTVQSGTASASCSVNVLASGATPGLPNTGGGYGQR
ncbi:MAG: hypothetical protein KGI41_03495 [Patescibacteria group bacterium]|nr:hypothetical protein [Patescibacteria group bacterium]MDE1966275.1 hypothetical protein [Patescibacteria group bacterium]